MPAFVLCVWLLKMIFIHLKMRGLQLHLQESTEYIERGQYVFTFNFVPPWTEEANNITHLNFQFVRHCWEFQVFTVCCKLNNDSFQCVRGLQWCWKNSITQFTVQKRGDFQVVQLLNMTIPTKNILYLCHGVRLPNEHARMSVNNIYCRVVEEKPHHDNAYLQISYPHAVCISPSLSQRKVTIERVIQKNFTENTIRSESIQRHLWKRRAFEGKAD